MIGSTRAVRVFAHAAPVDMRKAYEGLDAIVRNELARDILLGELYLFTNAKKTVHQNPSFMHGEIWEHKKNTMSFIRISRMLVL